MMTTTDCENEDALNNDEEILEIDEMTQSANCWDGI